MWIHQLIGQYWSALQAEQIQEAITAAVAPHTKQHEYWSLRMSLRSAMAPLRPIADAEPMPKIEVDDPKAAAREWFSQAGIKVVSSG